VNGPPCAVCGFTLRWLPQQNSWGCDRCQRMFPASGAPPQQAAPQAPSPYQQQGFGRPPQQQPSYPPQQAPQQAWQQPPPQQQPYGQQPPNPYGQQPGYGQQPPQQAYSPHPSQPPQPVPPIPSPGGKKGGKGLLIGGAIAAVAIAGGVVAFVMLRGGGGTKGGDGRDAVVKSTLAAMGDGDVSQLVRLADPGGLLDKYVDCSGKTKASDSESDSDDKELSEKDKEDRDPKKQIEKRKKEFEGVVALSKGAKIELVEITTKAPEPPKNDEKEKSGDDGLDGMVMKSGKQIFKGCVLKEPMRLHMAKLKVKTLPKGEKEAIEQDTEMMLLQFGKGFYLASTPTINLGAAALEKQLVAMKDKVCACGKAECAEKLKEEFKESPGYRDIKKQIRAMSGKDKERIDKIEDELKACEHKLEGGEQLTAMEGFKDKICACNDKACVEKVTQEMTVYGKTHSGDKLSENDIKQVTIIGEQIGKCMMKVDETERMRNPPPDSTGGIGSTIAGSTGGVAGGVPAACAAYLQTLEAFLTCKAIPESSRKDIENSMKMLPQMWKDYDRLPAASKKAVEDGCTQGNDAMKQSLAALKC
jgi:hypothetical protein